MAEDMMINVYRYFSEGELLLAIRYQGDTKLDAGQQLKFKETIRKGLQSTLTDISQGLSEKGGPFEDYLTNPKNFGETPPSEEMVALIRRARENCRTYLPTGNTLTEILSEYESCLSIRPLGQTGESGSVLAIDHINLLNIGRDMYVSSDDVDLALLYLVGELKMALPSKIREMGEAGIESISVSPNWRVAGAMSGGGLFSAPGVVPVPDTVTPEDATLDQYGFEAISGVSDMEKALDAAGFDPAREIDKDGTLDIFVLDTLPSAGHLEAIAVKYGKNEMIQHLFSGLKPNGTPLYHTDGLKRLQYYTDGSDKEFFDPSLTADGQDYDQSPHGPFVAGIIRSICGPAHIHMIQTLNDKGLGSLKSMTWAIRQVIDYITTHKERTVIVNMSFGLTIHPDDVGEDIDFPPAQFIRYLLKNVPQIDLLGEFNQAVETLTSLTDCVIAAAGNDGDCKTHYPPRLPAANLTVAGVGALVGNNPFDIAYYSNKADVDNQQRVGFYALGGETNRRYSSATKGLLSIYTNEKFPYGHPNQNGWGRWAGTSFAAPIVTGALGALILSGADKSNAMNALRQIVTEVPATLDIVPVKQKSS